MGLPEPYTAILDDYTAALRSAPLSDQTRRTYASKVRQFLAWLADGDADASPLGSKDTGDLAVRDYIAHMHMVLRRKPATINGALAAIDDLYRHRGLGPTGAARADLPWKAPKALTKRDALRFLRAVDACPSARDRAVALVPFYAGVRIAEIIALDVEDVTLFARRGNLRIHGRGKKSRQIPIHPKLLRALRDWVDERPHWRGAESPALFLSRRARRLSVRSAHDIITGASQTAGLEDDATAHMLRHTFATRLVQGGTDLETVAALLGCTRPENTLVYTRPSRPTRKGAIRALELLDVDR